MTCIFCSRYSKKEFLFENELAFAFYDVFPVSKGHMLIVSKRHVKTFFDLISEEQNAMIRLLNECKQYLDEMYEPDGYNVGLNCDVPAGQSVMHVHLHLIPRYVGDVENPIGGVRNVIPDKKDPGKRSNHG